MWKAALDALLALVPAILKPKSKDKSYEDLVKDLQDEIKADIIRLKDKKALYRSTAAKRKAKK